MLGQENSKFQDDSNLNIERPKSKINIELGGRGACMRRLQYFFLLVISKQHNARRSRDRPRNRNSKAAPGSKLDIASALGIHGSCHHAVDILVVSDSNA